MDCDGHKVKTSDDSLDNLSSLAESIFNHKAGDKNVFAGGSTMKKDTFGTGRFASLQDQFCLEDSHSREAKTHDLSAR